MKGVILAAGLGTRLRPLTHFVNKVNLPVYDQPILFYAIKTLVDSGIKDIVVVIGPHLGEQVKESIKYYPQNERLNFQFVFQEKPLGMPDAIKKAEHFVKKDSMFVIPGDNLFLQSFKNELKDFKNGAIAFLREVDDPSRFGVPIYRNNKLVDIVEKPEHSDTNLAVIAPYIFDEEVFNLISTLNLSARGELEIVDLLKLYMDRNQLKLIRTQGYWKDVGTFDALIEASLNMKEFKFSQPAE